MNYKVSAFTLFCSEKLHDRTINLIYSGRTGKHSSLSKSIYEKLKNSKLKEIDSVIFMKLQELKIIVPIDEMELDEINKENKQFTEQLVNETLLYVSIQTSAYCQLDCDYCGQVHEKLNISKFTIEKVINRIKNKCKPTHTNLMVGWFGGEPLYGMNSMRHLNAELKIISEERSLEYKSKITTNGVALKLDIYKELINEFNLTSLEITLDGLAEHHDKRRMTKGGKASFDVIFQNLLEIMDYRKFTEKEQCQISIRCNVDQRNFEGVIPLLRKLAEHQLQNRIHFYVANVRSWAQNKANQNLSLSEFANHQIDYFLAMKEFGFDVNNTLPTRSNGSFCLATNKESEMYDAYGNIFDCTETSYTPVYKNTEFNLGNINQIGNSQVTRSNMTNFNLDMQNGKYKKCASCIFYPICGGGCPKSWIENDPPCPSFIYNFEDRMLLDFLFRKDKIEKLQV